MATADGCLDERLAGVCGAEGRGGARRCEEGPSPPGLGATARRLRQAKRCLARYHTLCKFFHAVQTIFQDIFFDMTILIYSE